ncbi:poly(A)-binding protein 5 [Striga asiatica]|uniref:Poly(A)-binding protein 5 n=1 Tax=Striga asiatica TaxID=4170 RepID=A0A5A7QS63_STRAF|nr:poly(A)-binding protein 5 [Striga asiatica]
MKSGGIFKPGGSKDSGAERTEIDVGDCDVTGYDFSDRFENIFEAQGLLWFLISQVLKEWETYKTEIDLGLGQARFRKLDKNCVSLGFAFSYLVRSQNCAGREENIRCNFHEKDITKMSNV